MCMCVNKKNMKTTLFLSLLLLVSACSKELKIKDIVQTDEFGNVIGTSISEQWKPKHMTKSFNNDIFIDRMNEYIEMLYHGDKNIVLKYDCPLPADLQIIAFPNPVSNLADLRIKLKSSKPICLFDFSFIGLKGKDSGGGSATGEFYANNISDCKTEFNINPNGQINFPTDDMEIFFTVITDDGCVYTASGKVLVE